MLQHCVRIDLGNNLEQHISIKFTNDNYLEILEDGRYFFRIYHTKNLYDILLVCLETAIENNLTDYLFSALTDSAERNARYAKNLLHLNVQALNEEKSYDSVKAHCFKKVFTMLKSAGGYGNVSSINKTDKVFKMIGKSVSDLPNLSYLYDKEKFYSWYYANC